MVMDAFLMLKNILYPSCSMCFKTGYVKHSMSFMTSVLPSTEVLNSQMSSMPKMTRIAESNLPHLYFSGTLPLKVSRAILRLFLEAPALRHSKKTPFFRSI